MKTNITTLIKAMHVLAKDIQSDDGVANAAIAEAALRLEEQELYIKALNHKIARLIEEGDYLRKVVLEFIQTMDGIKLRKTSHEAHDLPIM